MLQNAYILAKISAVAAENEQNLPKFCQKLTTTHLRLSGDIPDGVAEVLDVHALARVPVPRWARDRGERG